MLERLKTQRAQILCDNGCVYGGKKGKVRRLASHVFWMLGRPTYLCVHCAKTMPGHYYDAATNWADERQAA